MKFGIRKKLLLTYILAVLIPVTVTIALFSLIDVYLTNNNDLENIDVSYGTVNQTISRIYDHYESIDDYDYFYQQVVSELNGKHNQIIIVDSDGYRIFDSTNKEATRLRTSYTLADQSYYDIHFIDEKEQVMRVVVPLIANDEVIGKAELTLDRIQLDESMVQKIITALIFTLVIGVLVLIILIILFTSTVSKGVIKPLHYLSDAAKRISNGELEQEIIYNKNNEFGEFSKTFDTMRVKLKDSLQKQHDLELARKELIASVSHDLRTPITSIKGYVEAIQDGKAQNEEKMQQYLRVIHDKTNKLDRLIDDLFQFSQLELGNLNLNNHVYNSKEMLESITSAFLLTLDTSVSLILEEPVASVDLYIDIHMIERVFDNILQNAYRYLTKENSVIRVSTNVHQSFLEVKISDNGEGIKSEDLPYIFNRFYRGEKSRSREYGGAGLGLSICKEIIEAHQGKIWVESIYGQGSTFYFQLPLYNSN